MIVTKSKQVWLHPFDVTSGIAKATSEIAPGMKAVGIISGSQKPRSSTSIFLCVESVAAKKFVRQLNEMKKLKRQIENANARTLKLTMEVSELSEKVVSLESSKDTLQNNLDTLLKNMDDPYLMAVSGFSRGGGSSNGIAKLMESGGTGKPLQGGLPGLGKRRK